LIMARPLSVVSAVEDRFPLIRSPPVVEMVRFPEALVVSVNSQAPLPPGWT